MKHATTNDLLPWPVSSSWMWIALILATSSGIAGCDSSTKIPMGTIEGQVNYQGKPISSGVVTFYSKELGIGISEELAEDGSYATSQPIQTGEYAVTILPPTEPPPVDERLLTVRREYKEIPEKYRDPRKSGLKIEVAEGVNSFNIEMMP